MARIGRAYGPAFSPDASRLAVISDLNGVPQLWIAPTAGGWPTVVTTGADPVGGVEWSPAGDWLAFTLLPGGGLNSQIYVVRPDGTGLRRLTDGGKENNWLSRWTWDGRHIVFSSNRRDPAAMDSWLVDVSSGTLTEVAAQPGHRQRHQRLRGRPPYGAVAAASAATTTCTSSTASGARTRCSPSTSRRRCSRGRSCAAGAPSTCRPTRTATSSRSIACRSVRMGRPGAWELLAERPDAELDGLSVNEQETLASITWNVGGRTELELLDLRTRARTPVRLPSELAEQRPFQPGRHQAGT